MVLHNYMQAASLMLLKSDHCSFAYCFSYLCDQLLSESSPDLLMLTVDSVLHLRAVFTDLRLCARMRTH